MKNNNHLILIALAAALGPIAAARAEFDPKIVPADARWVVSIDLNAVRESALGKEIIDIINSQVRMPVMRDDAVDLKLDAQKVFALVGSATAYGTSFSKDPKDMDGALVLQGTPELRKIAEAFVAQMTITSPDELVQIKDAPFEAYTIHGELTVGFPPEPIIVVSKSKAQLLKARDVFRNGAGSLAKNPSPLSGLIPKMGRYYVVAASVVPTDGVIPTSGPQARILQMATSGSIALGEDAKNTIAAVQLVSSTDDMAEKLVRILNGVSAMLSLTESSDKQLTEFLQSVKVERSAKTVMLNLAYPTEGIVRMVHSIQSANDNSRFQREAAVDAARRAEDGRRARQQRGEDNGKLVGQWVADQQIGQPTPTAESLVTHTIENVVLKNGATITLTGSRDDGENGRIDCVDILPVSGGTPLHFEAENMRLVGYQVEALPFYSGGRAITINGNRISAGNHALALFEFPGVDGTYTIKVRYVDENDGKSTFTVSVKDPETPAGPE